MNRLPPFSLRLVYSLCLTLIFWACNATDPDPRRVLQFELKNMDDQKADSFNVAIYSLPRESAPLHIYTKVIRIDSAVFTLAIDSHLPARFEADVRGFFQGKPIFFKRVQVEGNTFSSSINLPVDTEPIDPFNSVPLAFPDTLHAQEDAMLVFPASDLVKNDLDGDSDPLRVDSVFTPLHGAVSLSGGNITFIPEPDFFGEAGFTYRVNDNRGGKAIAQVYILLAPVDDPPKFTSLDPQSVEEGQELTFTVSAEDPDGDLLVYHLVQPPPGASFDTLSGLFSWTPDFDQDGEYILTFAVRDTSNPPLTDSMEVEIEVIDYPLTEINFATASGSGQEGVAALVTVALQSASLREVTIRLVTEDVTAQGGKDYTPLDTVLKFTPGQFSKALSVQVNDDALNEENETFRLVLKEPGNVRVGLIGTLEYTIVDNDPIPSGVICVDSAAAPGGDGKGWGRALRTLQEALTLAVSGQEIWLAKGTYIPGESRASTFTLKSGVDLYGGFAGGETQRDLRDPARNLSVLSGEIGAPGPDDNIHHVVVAWQATDVEVDGLVITAGNAVGSPPVAGVSGFTATSGGGVYAAGSGVTIRNTVFTDNRGVMGGALSTDGSLVVGCVFAGNAATRNGGGISGSRFKIYNSVFHKNSAERGGAVQLQRYMNTWNSAFIAFSTFTENVASYFGGALYANQNAPLEIRASILWANIAQDGSQIYFDGNHSHIQAWESTVQDRYADGSANSEGSANVIWSSGIVDINPGGNPGFSAPGNPLGPDGLWRTADDGLRLGSESPLRDKVTQAAPPELSGRDILGEGRVQGDKADMGAYEQ